MKHVRNDVKTICYSNCDIHRFQDTLNEILETIQDHEYKIVDIKYSTVGLNAITVQYSALIVCRKKNGSEEV